MDSSWRYNSLKLSREMKARYKEDKRRQHNHHQQQQSSDNAARQSPDAGREREARRRGRTGYEKEGFEKRGNRPNRQRQRHRPAEDGRYNTGGDRNMRYRSKSCDSIFSSRRKDSNEYGMLVPYRHPRYNDSRYSQYNDNRYSSYGDAYDNFNFDKYDNADFWEEELYNADKFDYDLNEDNDVPLEEHYNNEGSFDHEDSNVTPESLHATSYGASWNEEDYTHHDPVSSLQGSSLFKDGSATGAGSGSNNNKKKTNRTSKKTTSKVAGRGSKKREEDLGGDNMNMSLTVNDLDETTSVHSAASSSSASGRDNNNSSTSSPSFIVPPLHSEVRANMPSFGHNITAKSSKPTKKSKLVRHAIAHANSLREEHGTNNREEEVLSASQAEISELTNPTYAPPLHSAVRAKKPKKTGGNSVGSSTTDMVSELTTPTAILQNNVVRVPPLLSEVLKRKPPSDGGSSNSATASVGEDSGMVEPTQDTYRQQQPQSQQPQQQQHTRSRPPPPRPPPPRVRRNKHAAPPRRPSHPSSSGPDSFEDINSNSFFQRPLPPLKEENDSNHLPSSPTKSLEQELNKSPFAKSTELPATVVQLNDAAAQLLLMQGMSMGTNKSPKSSPSPNNARNHLSRSYSQPNNGNGNNLPFETLSRMQSQPNCSTTTPLQRASSSRLNNSYSGGLLLNPGNTAHRNRRVDQMPFTDDFGDSGLYSGEVNEDCRPNGQGRMKYENGVFFEGKWNDGVREGSMAQRERIMSGFTSWKGAGKKGGGNNVVHGMAWIDRFGKAGQYTGDVNEHSVPHGKGMMKYDFGLIAEGEWVNGILIDGPQPGMTVASQTVVPGGGTVFPGMANATMISGMGMGGITMGPSFPQMMNLNAGMGNTAMYGNQGPQGGPPTFIRKN